MPSFPRRQHPVWAVAFSNDGKFLASGTAIWHQPEVAGELRVWEIATRRELVLEGHTSGVYSVGFTADSKRLVSASNDQTVRVWDLATQREQARLTADPLKPSWRYWALLSPDDRILLTGWQGQRPGGISLSEFPSDKSFAVLAERCAAFSSDGRALATCGSDGIKLWGITPGKPPVTLSLPSQSPQSARALDFTSLALAPDMRRLATG